MHQKAFGGWAPPRPAGGAYALPRPSSCNMWPTSKGRGGEGRGRGGSEREERGSEREERRREREKRELFHFFVQLTPLHAN